MVHKIMAIVMGVTIAWTIFIGCAHLGDSSSEVNSYRISVEYCENMGREAGTYQAYYDCTVKLGLRDGG